MPGATSELDASRPDGTEVAYTLCFPKSFTASLKGCRVNVRGTEYRVIGDRSATTRKTPQAIGTSPWKWGAPMAKCKVKFEWKGWKRGGYAEVMNSGAVQTLLKKKADAAAASCNSSFSRHPRRGCRLHSPQVQGQARKRLRGYHGDSARPCERAQAQPPQIHVRRR